MDGLVLLMKYSCTSLKPPCKPDCPRRSATCHSAGECNEYAEYCVKRDAEKERNAAAAKSEMTLNDLKRTGIKRSVARYRTGRRR